MEGRHDLKQYFETGDRPTELQFSKLIDSGINQVDDPIRVDDEVVVIGNGPGTNNLNVNTNMSVRGEILGDDLNLGAADVLDISNDVGIRLYGRKHSDRANEIVFGKKNGATHWKENVVLNKHGFLGVGTSDPVHRFQVGDHINKVVIGEANGESFGWTTGYIGLNAARVDVDGDKEWLLHTDGAHNGGAMIHVDAVGTMSFSTIEDSSDGTSDRFLTDEQMKSRVRMRIDNSGRIGINQKDPKNRLHISNPGRPDTGLRLETGKGNGKVLVSDADGNASWEPKSVVTDGLWEVHSVSGTIDGQTSPNVSFMLLSLQKSANIGDKFTINHISNGNSGYVGIGTTEPKYPLHVAKSLLTNQASDYDAVKQKKSGVPIDPNKASVGLFVENEIWCEMLRLSSDTRIKKIDGISEGKQDLSTLNQIQITDYTLISDNSPNKKQHKKVIGQQLAEVFPQAVSLGTDAVPNVYKLGSYSEGWVSIEKHGLVAGDKVKLVLDGKNNTVNVLEANEKGFRIANTELSPQNVFVYGKIVNDFHVVDYSAISMLNVSATQQLHKELIELRKRVGELEKQLDNQTV